MSDFGCSATLDEHISVIFDFFMDVHMGGGCEDTYKALMEVAEACRVVHGYAPYTPVKTTELLTLNDGSGEIVH